MLGYDSHVLGSSWLGDAARCMICIFGTDDALSGDFNKGRLVVGTEILKLFIVALFFDGAVFLGEPWAAGD